jgi:hypothetical protein
MRELSALAPQYQIFDIDGDVKWNHWKVFRQTYNIKSSSMRSLVREHATSLKLKGNKRSKKTETDAQKVGLYKKIWRGRRTPHSKEWRGFAR